MTEPSQNAMSGSNPINRTFQDPTAFGYNQMGTRSDTTESVSEAPGSLVEMPVDVGARRDIGDPAPSQRAQGGTAFDPSSQMTAQSRWGSRRDAEADEARKILGAEGPIVKGNASAVEDARQEVGFLEGRLGTVASQTRNA
ncbi:hypothetical protein WOLCODRAFT_18983 [Wolfiporia cocos MD-104 SS10]|uniref:Uncharacterized protein n=1 Tax=Wolfiporia cocos (strain MD-104) TaxID=742152 RepID=A0A2H3JQV5_WOLCO|nr:hypothetical protein WOLCODRAFT_18983 [Wolfiporia cocos MD-104 SS10]